MRKFMYFCTVMETKEYYQSLMAVIDYVAEGHKDLTAEKGQELSGRYWPRIYELFKAERIGTPFEGGSIYITRGQYLNPIYEDCIHAIKELDEQEADRELDRASKYAGIKYAKRAYWISIISIVVAAVAFVWQIVIQILKA